MTAEPIPAPLRLLPPAPTSTPAEPLPLGSITPRLWTRPLRPLTPETSYGFRVIWFAAFVLGEPLDPWQQWLAIHIGELLADGRPRFRQVLVIVGRQNGKTHLLRVLALYWLFVERWPLTFGTSTNLEQAAESWQETVDTAKALPALAGELPRNAVRLANGQQAFRTNHRTRYLIGAVNRKGGRGKRIDRLVGDELREHHNWAGYNAAYGAMNARPYGQAVFITNQGDAKAVVLASLRRAALDYLRTGAGDERLGIFEWSAPDGTHPMDVAGWAAANPQLGRRVDYDTLRGLAARVAKPGADPEELASFLTEYLCMRVDSLDPAIDQVAWSQLPAGGTLDDVRDRVAMVLDVAPGALHATLYAAAVLDDDRVQLDVVKDWSGPGCTEQVRRDLPGLLAATKPRAFGWLPDGPAAALAADLADRRKAGRYGWPPRGVAVHELRTELPAVCMGFADLVIAGRLQLSGDTLLDGQARAAGRQFVGVRWVFARTGVQHVDAVYAAAGAVHLARTLPTRRRVAGRLHTAGE